MKTCLTTLAALAAALLLTPGQSRAETRACTAITSLPATLSAPGVYCMKNDLASAATNGRAITLAANDIVLDCNGYKLGGLGAGPDTQAIGIGSSQGLQLATVRNCNVRGFRHGIVLEGYGIVVAENRMDGNSGIAIDVNGNQALVQGNRVLDTGGIGAATGIRLNGSGELRDNTVSGVMAGIDQASVGIEITDVGPMISSGNRVRGVSGNGAGAPMPIAFKVQGVARLVMNADNLVGTGVGMYCSAVPAKLMSDVVLSGFQISVSGCSQKAE